MQHLKVFGLMPTASPLIPRMPTVTVKHDWGDVVDMRGITQFNHDIVPGYVQQMEGPKVIQARWVLARENGYADGPGPVPVFERGGYDVTKYIRMLRPMARRLRQMGQKIDAIFLDNEGGFSIFALQPDQLRALFANPKIRRRMPPAVRNTSPEKLIVGGPQYDPPACLPYLNWVNMMQIKAMRQIFIDSKLFHVVRGPGQSPTPPQVINFNWMSGARRVYDHNGWPIDPGFSIDGGCGNIAMYYTRGGGRYVDRNHDVLWNKLTDYVNYGRACMATGKPFWPTILQPVRNNPWLFEQMIGHLARTGVNWTASKSGYVYFNELYHMTPVSDPKLVEIFSRHDQPFPIQRNLPDIPLDSDRIETAGFVTTYADFLQNVGLNQLMFNDQPQLRPMKLNMREMQAAA